MRGSGWSKYALRMDGGYWTVLTELPSHRWQLQVWGPETMQTSFVGLTAREAKQHAIALVSLFLLDRRLDVHVPEQPVWRPMTSSRTEERYRLQR